MGTEQTRIDAHLHLFNLSFLLKELVNMGWDAVWGNYPHKKGFRLGEMPETYGFSIRDTLKTIAKLSDWFVSMMKGVVSDADKQYEFLEKAYRNAFSTSDGYAAVPLMMDIYYALARETGDVLRAPEAAGETGIFNPEAEFGEFVNMLKAEVQESLKNIPGSGTMLLTGAPEGVGDIPSLIDVIVGDFRENYLEDGRPLMLKEVRNPMLSFPQGVEKSWGFESNFHELIDLEREYRGRVFPFLAVDPRRRGIMDLVRAHVGSNGPFYGIKLYPRLGYRITETVFAPLFDFCVAGDIPITVHTSTGGFPPGTNWKYRDYCDPASWENILKQPKYRSLRVNFAHFGGDDEVKKFGTDDWKQSWTRTIVSFLDYPNVYTDASCYTDKGSLEKIKEIMDDNEAVRSKMLFGTDNPVVFLTDIKGIDTYYHQFRETFSPRELDDMMVTNPVRFLKSALPAKAFSVNVNRNVRVAPAPAPFAYATGWLPDHPDFRDYGERSPEVSPLIMNTGIAAGGSEPGDTADLSPYCSPIEDQGGIGSCTAHAGVGMVEYFENRAFGKYLDASRLFLYKVTRNIMQTSGDSGANIRKTMAALALFGVPPEDYWPYSDSEDGFDREPTAFCYSFAENYKALKYYRLDINSISRNDLLKKVRSHLFHGIPVMFGFSVFNSIAQAKESGDIPFPHENESMVGGHAVMAVGYDDNRRIVNSYRQGMETTGAIKIRNSWGTEWGEDGYGWLPYEYVLKGIAVDWWVIIKNDWTDTGVFD